MQSTDDIYEALETLAATGGTNDKAELLRGYMQHELFRDVMKAALNPYRTYGIAAVPETDAGEAVITSLNPAAGYGKLLEDFATRNLTGNAATEALINAKSKLTPASGEVLRRIITRDLRCKVTATLVNKVSPGFIPVFDCMLAHKFNEKHVKYPVLVEPKLDGVRVLVIVTPNAEHIGFYTRTGKPLPSLDHLASEIKHLTIEAGYKSVGLVLDGEAVAGQFNKTVGDIRRSAPALDAEIHLFDLLSYEYWDSGEKRIGERIQVRREFLQKAVKSVNVAFGKESKLRVVPQYIVNSLEEIDGIYERIREKGGEGVIVKALDGCYERKRSRNWLKIKAEESVDLIITGFFEGTGKYEGQLGGLICDHKGVEVRVGGGFSDEQRQTLWTNLTSDYSTEQVIGRMIEVGYHEETPDGSLRHPRFVGFRDDKHDAEAA